MKPSDYPEQDARTVPFQSEDKDTVLARRVPEPETRYLTLPKTPEERTATRNLTWAIVCLVVAAMGYWLGLIYAGAAATRTLVACLGTFGILWLLSALNVLRQKYGVLLGLGLAVVLGAAIPFIEGGFRRLDGLARERLASQDSTTTNLSVPPPPPTSATAPPAPPTIPLPQLDAQNAAGGAYESAATKATEGSGAAPLKAALAAAKPGEDMGVVSELVVPEPEPGAGKLIRVKEDVKVTLDGRARVIRAGTVAPFKELKDGQVTFLANDHEVSIDFGLVTFTGASREKPEQITKLAQEEALRRYPKLGEQDSKENILYVTRVKEIQLSPEKEIVFKDAKWPLVIAEQLAEQEGWRRSDLGLDPIEEPAVPANELPAKPTEVPGAAPVPPATGEPEPLLPEPSPVPEQASEPPPAR